MTLDSDEKLFVEHFLKVYPEGDLTLWDVGAAEGRFTRGFVEAAHPRTVKARLFEPRPDSAVLVGLGTVHWSAVGAYMGWEMLTETTDPLLSHLDRNHAALREYCGERGIEIPRDSVAKTYAVGVVTVDYILGSGDISYLKIDTEGYEMEVLQGARTSLDRITAVQFEYGGTWIGMGHLAEAAALLFDYNIYTYDGHGMVRKTSFEDDYTWSGNFLAIRE